MQKVYRNIIKIDFKKDNGNFSDRERTLSFEIQRIIDSYHNKGLLVLEHKILMKSTTHALVEFVYQKMKRIID